MAKKPTTPKAAEQDVKAAAPKTKPKAAPKKAAAKPKTAKAPAAHPSVKSTPVTKPTKSITPADIALRAYFIAEKRQKLGLPGDSVSDWVAAERQLQAEAAAAKKAE